MEIQTIKKLRTIYENAPIGAVFFDCLGNVKVVNRFYKRISGGDKFDSNGMTFFYKSGFICGENLYKNLVKAINTGSNYHQNEVFYKSKVSRKFWYLNISIGPLKSLNNDGIFAYLFARDVTAQVIAKNKIKKMNRDLLKEVKHKTERIEYKRLLVENLLTEKNVFLSNIAHELRTMLTIIKGSIELKEQFDEILDRKKLQKFDDDIKEELEKMDKMLNDMIFVAKTDNRNAFKKENLDLHTLVSEIVRHFEVLAKQKNITLRNKVGQAFEMKADYKQIESLLKNLIHNGIKYGREGGFVEITSRLNKDGQPIIVIKDNGIGIKKDDLKKIFAPFFQVDKTSSGNERGFGLGLSICKKIVDCHKGELQLKSVYGKGTAIKIMLPKNRVNL